MKSLFLYSDYKSYLLERINHLSEKKRGELGKIARALRIHTSRLSHILRGHLHFTFEQACDLSEYLGLSALESEYFLSLVELERAGNSSLKKIIENRLKRLQADSKQLVKRLDSKQLTEADRSLFYSNWLYSAIRIGSSLPHLNTVDDFSNRFGIPRSRVSQMVEFLVKTGLCTQEQNKLQVGPSYTHLSADSPLASRHHSNWRLKAIQQYQNLQDHELAYTSPVSLSQKDMQIIREELAQFIEKFVKRIKDSKEEKLAYLNIDWLEF